jgi:hypothetical protein
LVMVGGKTPTAAITLRDTSVQATMQADAIMCEAGEGTPASLTWRFSRAHAALKGSRAPSVCG